MTDEQRVKNIDLTGGNATEEEILFALNFLLNLPDEELPLFEDE